MCCICAHDIGVHGHIGMCIFCRLHVFCVRVWQHSHVLNAYHKPCLGIIVITFHTHSHHLQLNAIFHMEVSSETSDKYRVSLYVCEVAMEHADNTVIRLLFVLFFMIYFQYH